MPGRLLRRWLPPSVLAASLIGLLAHTWLRWGDLLVDTGRELYVPTAILWGRVLYRDIFYLYGPFPPYLHALLQAILGNNVLGVVLGGILATAAACFLLYRLARIWLPELYACWTALTFLFVFAFGNYLYHGIFNFILPYSSSATYGMVLALAAFWAFHQHLEEGGCPRILLCAFFTGLTFLTRIETGLCLWLSLGAAVLLARFRKSPVRGATGGSFLVLTVLSAGAAILVWAFFVLPAWDRLGGSAFLDHLRGNVGSGSFTSMILGTDRPERNLSILRDSFLLHLALAVLFAAGGLVFDRLGRARQPWLRRLAFAAGGAFLLAGLGITVSRFRWGLQYSLTPFLALVVLAVAAAGYVRGGLAGRAGNLSLVALSLFAFLMTGRIFLQAWPGHYGFWLLVPGMLVTQVLFFRILPGILKPPAARSFFRAGFLLVSAALLLAHVRVWREFYASRTLEVASPRGTLLFRDDRGNRDLREMILFLQREARPGDALVVFPEGLTINVLAGLPNPLYDYQYLPLDIRRESRERGIIAELEACRPSYVSVVDRSLEEYGSAGFGRDYGLLIMDYLAARYDVARRFGESAVLLARRD